MDVFTLKRVANVLCTLKREQHTASDSSHPCVRSLSFEEEDENTENRKRNTSKLPLTDRRTTPNRDASHRLEFTDAEHDFVG